MHFGFLKFQKYMNLLRAQVIIAEHFMGEFLKICVHLQPLRLSLQCCLEAWFNFLFQMIIKLLELLSGGEDFLVAEEGKFLTLLVNFQNCSIIKHFVDVSQYVWYAYHNIFSVIYDMQTCLCCRRNVTQ
jgi:hypothetical protein